MGAKPVVATLSSGIINPSTLNSNFDILATAIADSLDRAGDSDTNNIMTGDLDMGGFSVKNIAGTNDIGAAVTSTAADAASASASAGTATTQAGIATTQAGIATTQAGISTAQAAIATAAAEDAISIVTNGATVLATPDTIPKRDSNGDLAGNILGNAATATKVGVLNFKVIEIGDWDMDANVGKTNIAHGIANGNLKIRSISVAIRPDSDTTIYDLVAGTQQGTATANAGSFLWDATAVSLYRATSGPFDAASFDSTSYNRGWITISYID